MRNFNNLNGRPTEKMIGMKNQRELLKKAGAVYTPGHGWAIPDPNTGTCWWDDSSYNGTIFLGANAREAIERLRELDNDDAD